VESNFGTFVKAMESVFRKHKNGIPGRYGVKAREVFRFAVSRSIVGPEMHPRKTAAPFFVDDHRDSRGFL